MKPTWVNYAIVAVFVGAGVLLGIQIAGEQLERGQTDLPVKEGVSTDQQMATNDLTSVRQEIERLRRDLAALREKAKRPTAKHNDRAPNANGKVVEATSSWPAESDEVDGVATTPYAHLPDDRVDQAIADDLDYSLAAEPVDHEWSQHTTRLVVETIAQVGAFQLESVVCRSSFCRAELLHKGEGDLHRDLDELTMQPPWNAYGFVQVIDPEGDESSRSVVYFSREGYTLPGPVGVQ